MKFSVWVKAEWHFGLPKMLKQNMQASPLRGETHSIATKIVVCVCECVCVWESVRERSHLKPQKECLLLLRTIYLECNRSDPKEAMSSKCVWQKKWRKTFLPLSVIWVSKCVAGWGEIRISIKVFYVTFIYGCKNKVLK